MFIAQVFEWPHPQIDDDWERNELRWREITPLADWELKAIAPLLHEAEDGGFCTTPQKGIVHSETGKTQFSLPAFC